MKNELIEAVRRLDPVDDAAIISFLLERLKAMTIEPGDVIAFEKPVKLFEHEQLFTVTWIGESQLSCCEISNLPFGPVHVYDIVDMRLVERQNDATKGETKQETPTTASGSV